MSFYNSYGVGHVDAGYTNRTFNNRSYASTRDDGFGQGYRENLFTYG